MHQYQILAGLERFSETIPFNVNFYKSELDGAENLWRPSRFFDIIQFNFVNIHISWNSLGKPFKTIQTL